MYSQRIQITYELTSFNFLQMFEVLGQAGTCQRVQVLCESKWTDTRIKGRAVKYRGGGSIQKVGRGGLKYSAPNINVYVLMIFTGFSLKSGGALAPPAPPILPPMK